jgi:hypothetical protein
MEKVKEFKTEESLSVEIEKRLKSHYEELLSVEKRLKTIMADLNKLLGLCEVELYKFP